MSKPAHPTLLARCLRAASSRRPRRGPRLGPPLTFLAGVGCALALLGWLGRPAPALSEEIAAAGPTEPEALQCLAWTARDEGVARALGEAALEEARGRGHAYRSPEALRAAMQTSVEDAWAAGPEGEARHNLAFCLAALSGSGRGDPGRAGLEHLVDADQRLRLLLLAPWPAQIEGEGQGALRRQAALVRALTREPGLGGAEGSPETLGARQHSASSLSGSGWGEARAAAAIRGDLRAALRGERAPPDQVQIREVRMTDGDLLVVSTPGWRIQKIPPDAASLGGARVFSWERGPGSTELPVPLRGPREDAGVVVDVIAPAADPALAPDVLRLELQRGDQRFERAYRIVAPACGAGEGEAPIPICPTSRAGTRRALVAL